MLEINENCEIVAIYKRIVLEPAKTNRYIIEIKEYQNESVFEIKCIKLNNPQLSEELNDLKNNKIQKIYTTNSEEDVDIFFDHKRNEYCIECSSISGECKRFYFKKENFEKELINMLVS